MFDWRVSLYLFLAIAITAGGLVQRFAPDPDADGHGRAKPANAEAPVAPPAGEKTEAKADIGQPAEPAAAPTAVVSAAAATKADAKGEASPDKKVEEKKPEKTKQERAAERKAEREKQLAEAKAEKEKERRIFTSGSYWETVKWSAGRFPEKAAE